MFCFVQQNDISVIFGIFSDHVFCHPTQQKSYYSERFANEVNSTVENMIKEK